MKIKLGEVPAMVYVWPDGWAARRTILTPIAERIQRPYHHAHYDKKQLTVSAIAALFIQLVQAGDIVVKPNSLLWEGSNTVPRTGSKTIYQRLFANKNKSVESAVANLLDKPIPHVWDHYDDALAAEAAALGYADEPQARIPQPELPWSITERPTPGSLLWRAEQMSETLHAAVRVFGHEEPVLFKTIWGGIVRGIQSREAGLNTGASLGSFGDISWLDGVFGIS